MDLIINTIFVCLITFNISACIIEWKKIKHNYKLKKQRLKEKNEKLEEKKKKLNIELKYLKKEKFNKNIYAKFTKKDADYILKVTNKIKINQDLAHFESALLKNIKIEFMRNFFINAPYITIKKFSMLEAPIKNDHKILGTYNVSTKEIKVYDKKESTLTHELLHAASSDFTYSAVGFSVEFKKSGMFGEGLNEGYTELINNRIFKYKSKSYIHLQYLARLIENFFEDSRNSASYQVCRLLGMYLGEFLPRQRIDGERFCHHKVLLGFREVAFYRGKDFRGSKALAVVQNHAIERLASQFG